MTLEQIIYIDHHFLLWNESCCQPLIRAQLESRACNGSVSTISDLITCLSSWLAALHSRALTIHQVTTMLATLLEMVEYSTRLTWTTWKEKFARHFCTRSAVGIKILYCLNQTLPLDPLSQVNQVISCAN